MLDAVRLAEVLSTRLCHDLAGSISATHNGVELISGDHDVDEEMATQVMDLLKLSSGESLAKLQMFRMAYGRTFVDGVSDVSEVIDIMKRYYSNSKIDLIWSEDDISGFGKKIDNVLRRIIALSSLVISSQLIFGGTLSVLNKDNCISIIGCGSRIKERSDFSNIFSEGYELDEDFELSVDNVLVVYLVTILKKGDFIVKYDYIDDNVSIKILL